MYRRHFGLKEKPFAVQPDPDFLYLSEKHARALATLEYGVFEQSGITVLTGEVGAGKTTVVRYLLKRMESTGLTVGLVSNVHPSLGSLLTWIALALNLPYEGMTDSQLFRNLQSFLLERYAAGGRVVLFIDEAQNLGSDRLEELRMLTNINADKDYLLQIVLVGQPQLLDLLCRPDMMQTAQRVTAEYHLESLGLKETTAYVRHRLRVAAGRDIRLFEPQALLLIHYFSGGVPRLINTLCDHCLVLAYGQNQMVVGTQTTLEALKEKRIGGFCRYMPPAKDAAEARCMVRTLIGLDVADIQLGEDGR